MKKISLLVVGLLLLMAFGFAVPPEKVDAFVCPVITSEAVGMHNPNAVPIGENHTTIGPSTTADHLRVPIHATNRNGEGTPGGVGDVHAQPGDTDYTAIWASS